jgi:hypothetical protein
MADRLTVRVTEPETAIRLALDGSQTRTRQDLIRRALVAGGTLTFGGVLVGGLPRFGHSAPSPAQDARILNLVLLLEYLEEAFYADALRQGALRGELRQFARVVGSHERAHVAFIEKTLGAAARKKPARLLVRRRDPQPGEVHRRGSGARRPERLGVQRSGNEPDQRRPGRGRPHRLGRGPPRRLDSIHRRQVAGS